MTKSILKNIFSITKTNTHKTIIILGIKIHIKRKSNSGLENLTKELYYASIFNNLINCTEWIKQKDFIPTGGAANYSFLFTLFCALKMGKPQNILEFGIGQTSKLTSQYASYFPQTNLQIVEHDSVWINNMKAQLNLCDNIEIIQKNLIKRGIKGSQNYVYDDLSDVVANKKYNLLILDGPYGFNNTYPRTNILDLIPQNLAEQFVIILDDVERIGEQNTMRLIFEKLKENNIEFEYKISGSIKRQLMITSKNMAWLNLY